MSVLVEGTLDADGREMTRLKQLTLIEMDESTPARASSTFVNNMSLPVHRWFRYSAGFSAEWAESTISDHKCRGNPAVLDPFAGSATTLLAAEDVGVPSIGVESHPFVCRVARAKLLRHHDPGEYRQFALAVLRGALDRKGCVDEYPCLIRRCFKDDSLADLDRLRRSFEALADGSPRCELTWLTLVSILRSTSHVGTAQWQYVLPNKSKQNARRPFEAFEHAIEMFFQDLRKTTATPTPAQFIEGDARACQDVPTGFASLVVTSPPYPNNYDYADATRLEMTFMGEIQGWGNLQGAVRRHLIRSCSQHTTRTEVDLEATLNANELRPIANEIRDVCDVLGKVRLTKGGKKNYHLMVASYFLDLAKVWNALRRVCATPCDVYFVVGDSAPYGVYVPVIDWLGKLAVAAGFERWSFDKIRDRNIKWKNRKHRVPLCEGHLLVQG